MGEQNLAMGADGGDAKAAQVRNEEKKIIRDVLCLWGCE